MVAICHTCRTVYPGVSSDWENQCFACQSELSFVGHSAAAPDYTPGPSASVRGESPCSSAGGLRMDVDAGMGVPAAGFGARAAPQAAAPDTPRSERLEVEQTPAGEWLDRERDASGTGSGAGMAPTPAPDASAPDTPRSVTTVGGGDGDDGADAGEQGAMEVDPAVPHDEAPGVSSDAGPLASGGDPGGGGDRGDGGADDGDDGDDEGDEDAGAAVEAEPAAADQPPPHEWVFHDSETGVGAEA